MARSHWLTRNGQQWVCRVCHLTLPTVKDFETRPCVEDEWLTDDD